MIREMNDSRIINGKILAHELEIKLADQFIELSKIAPDETATIVSYFNPDHPPSAKYTRMKREAAVRVGISFNMHEYTLETDLPYIKALIKGDNEDPNVDGIMMQLPAPGDLGSLINNIAPEKDVDGLTDEGRRLFVPATAKGTLAILESYLHKKLGIEWWIKRIAVLGSKGTVGSALMEVFDRGEIRLVNGVDLDTSEKDRAEALSQADILISATGREETIDSDEVKEGFIFINVGLGEPAESLLEKASYYTPRVGAVGPMTIWALMDNGRIAFTNRLKRAGYSIPESLVDNLRSTM